MENAEAPTKFSSKDEEISYWKNIAQKIILEKDNLQKEYDEYREESLSFEKELEATIEQNEKKIKEQNLSILRNKKELESLHLRLEQANHENIDLQSEVSSLNNEKVQIQKRIRDLEQKNDDLERKERIVVESMAAFEASLNQEIERNAILESEVYEKERLMEKLQRISDEARDLKHELFVSKRPDNDRALNGLTNGAAVMDSNRLKIEIETQTTPVKRDITKTNLLDRPLTPSSRVLALNIIGELMRKVGQLENKLGDCRPDYRSSSENIRKRHQSRGRTSPSLQSLK